MNCHNVVDDGARMQVHWKDYFGMFIDRFGINWLINYAALTDLPIEKNNGGIFQGVR